MHSNIQGIVDYAWPTTVKACQRCHGMVNCSRLHVPRLSDKMRPVTSPFSRKRTLTETPELRKPFDQDKAAIQAKVILAAFDTKTPVFLITDASDIALEELVTHDRKGIPLAWLSKTLSPAEQKGHANE